MAIQGVVIGDVHFCEKNPICRKDDIRKTQIAKMEAIAAICNGFNCPLYIAGDLFDSWNIGFELVNEVNRYLIGNISHTVYFIAGNHDLPNHSMELYDKSPISCCLGERLDDYEEPDYPVRGVNFGCAGYFPEAPVYLEHRMCFLTDPIKGYEDKRYDVKHLITQPPYDNKQLIITGDNHQAFAYRHTDGRVWLNTGPIMRTSVAEKLCEPSVWYFRVSDDAVELRRIPLPVNIDAVDRIEMYIKQVKDSMVSEFAEEIKNHTTATVDYSVAVTSLATKAEDAVQKAVTTCVDEAKTECNS